MAANKEASASDNILWTVLAPYRVEVDDCLKRTNWDAIRERASQANNGQPCNFLAHETCGANNMARMLEFQDGTRWVARVLMNRPTESLSAKMKSEIDTTVFLKTHTKAPVPQVFAYELDETNPAGVAYMLLEMLPGNDGMTLCAEYEKKHNKHIIGIPAEFRQEAYRTLAAAHVSQLAPSYVTYLSVP